MFTVGESPPIYQANEREQQTQQRWIQQVAGNPRRRRFTRETLQERERRLEIHASNGTEKATLSTRDRGYSDHKYVQRRQQNTNITLQTKPTKRGNFFDATIGNKSYIICKTYMRNIFPTD